MAGVQAESPAGAVAPDRLTRRPVRARRGRTAHIRRPASLLLLPSRRAAPRESQSVLYEVNLEADADDRRALRHLAARPHRRHAAVRRIPLGGNPRRPAAPPGRIRRIVQYRLRDRARARRVPRDARAPRCARRAPRASATASRAERRVLPHREEFVRGAVSTENCLNCGEVLTGQHCSHCGQHAQGARAVAVGTDQGRDRRPARRRLARLAHAVAAGVPARPAHAGVPARPARALHAAVPHVPGAEPGVLRAGVALRPGRRSRRCRLDDSAAPTSSCATTARHLPTARRHLRDAARDGDRPPADARCPAAPGARSPAARRRDPAAGDEHRRSGVPEKRARSCATELETDLAAATPADHRRAAQASWRTPAARRPCRSNAGPVLEQYEPRLRDACRKIIADQQSFGRALFDNIPKMMFIFLPLIAAVMAVLYVRSGRYYVEHLLFVVHFHAFFFLAGHRRAAARAAVGADRGARWPASSRRPRGSSAPCWCSTCRGTCSRRCGASTSRAGGRPCRSSRCSASRTSSASCSPAIGLLAYTALTL